MNFNNFYGIIALITGFLFLGQTILGLIGGIGDSLDFNTDTAGKFLKDTVQAVQQSSILSEFLPGLGGILGKLDKFDKKNQIQSGENPEQLEAPEEPESKE